MFTAQSEIKYLATKSSCLVTAPHHYQITTASFCLLLLFSNTTLLKKISFDPHHGPIEIKFKNSLAMLK